jgi:hypothetical protein
MSHLRLCIVFFPCALAWLHVSAAHAEIHFSHDTGTVGLPPSAVSAFPDIQDIFATGVPLGGGGAFSNFLVADNPVALGLQPGDNIDALHDSGTRQYGASGLFQPAFVFSVRSGAVAQTGMPINVESPFNAADLYQVDANQGHFLLNRANQMGLSKTTVAESIDALALEPGIPFSVGQRAHFSLAPGSPTLVNNGWSAADILTAIVGVPGSLQVSIPANRLGLNPGDNVDGLIIYEAADLDGDGRLDGPTDKRSVYFSVAPGSSGIMGTAVRMQFMGNGAANDIFTSGGLSYNTLIIDGVRWTRLVANDDVDGLDVYNVFFGNPPFLFAGVLPPLPVRDPATLPPAYQTNPTPKPIGGFYVPICADPTPRDVWYEIILKMCAPNGAAINIVSNGIDHLAGPGDADYKANKIAEILRGMTLVNPGGDPTTDAKNVFAGVVVGPPNNVNAPGVVAEICVVVDQDILDRGWALDAVCISFNGWTLSVVPVCELALGPPPPAAAFYRLPAIELVDAPVQPGFLRLSFWNGDPDNLNILQYGEPFIPGQAPISILQGLRNQIVNGGGDAELDGNKLFIAKVAVEPDPLVAAEAGPYMYEAGAIGNDLIVTIDMRGTHERVALLGCGGYLTGDCCSESSTASCNNAKCCNQVCLLDPFCCDAIWDASCAEAASQMAVCGCGSAPPNDECDSPLLFNPGSLPFDNFFSTSSGPPDPCGLPGGSQNDVWFSFVSPCDAPATLEISPSFHAIVSLYNDCPLAGGTELACSEAFAGQTTAITVPTIAGQQMILRVGSPEGQGSGVLTLTVNCPTPCPADITGNLVVDVDDLLTVINSWGFCRGCAADIAPPDGNNVVDVDDLLTVINAWGPCL